MPSRHGRTRPPASSSPGTSSLPCSRGRASGPTSTTPRPRRPVFTSALALTTAATALLSSLAAQLAAHSLGGLLVQRALVLVRGGGGSGAAGNTVPVVPKNPLLPGHPAEIYLVLLGTPYFGPLAAEAGRDEEERAVEQVRRLGKVLLGPAQIEDPRETCRLWRSVAGEVLDRQGRMTVRAASFREGLPWDGDGVILKEAFSSFAAKDSLNFHVGLLDMVKAHGYKVDTAPPKFKLEANLAHLGRARDANDPLFTSIVKMLCLYNYRGGLNYHMSMEAASGGDWFG